MVEMVEMVEWILNFFADVQKFPRGSGVVTGIFVWWRKSFENWVLSPPLHHVIAPKRHIESTQCTEC